MTTIQTRIWDCSATVERIAHLGTQLASDVINDELADWLLDDDQVHRVLGGVLGISAEEFTAALNEFGDRRSEREEALQDISRQLTGWLIEVSAPRIDWHENGSSGSVHVGWRTLHITYADSYDVALNAAVAWAEDFTMSPKERAAQAEEAAE